MRELFPIYAKRFTSLAANYKSLSQKWTNTSTCHQLLSVVNTTGYQRLPIDVEPKGKPRCRLTKRTVNVPSIRSKELLGARRRYMKSLRTATRRCVGAWYFATSAAVTV